jgi:hypothetical protein
LLTWLERRGGALEDFVCPSRVDHARHLSTRQYGRSSMSGSQPLGSNLRNTAHTRCDGRRLR